MDVVCSMEYPRMLEHEQHLERKSTGMRSNQEDSSTPVVTALPVVSLSPPPPPVGYYLLSSHVPLSVMDHLVQL